MDDAWMASRSSFTGMEAAWSDLTGNWPSMNPVDGATGAAWGGSGGDARGSCVSDCCGMNSVGGVGGTNNSWTDPMVDCCGFDREQSWAFPNPEAGVSGAGGGGVSWDLGGTMEPPADEGAAYPMSGSFLLKRAGASNGSRMFMNDNDFDCCDPNPSGGFLGGGFTGVGDSNAGLECDPIDFDLDGLFSAQNRGALVGSQWCEDPLCFQQQPPQPPQTQQARSFQFF